MTSDELLSRTLAKLETHWATRAIASAARAPGYDRSIARRVCGMLFEKCGRDPGEYDTAVDDFIAFSVEFVELQMELDRTGRYKFATYEEARAAVYDNPGVMERRYLNGLFLSTAFWANHTKIFRYFAEDFCARLPARGAALEVPAGTGIFLAEFAQRNPGWHATGADISESSVAYAREVIRLYGVSAVTIEKRDIFDVTTVHSYDRIICGELLEHLEKPERLLERLAELLAPHGKIFLTTAIWAANIDHIYLFESAREARDMLSGFFTIESELVLNVFEAKQPEEERTPINYACILTR